MRFPEFLKEHGTIGFVAPSFGCATEPYYTAFAHARERFGQMGYHTQMGPNCLVDKGIGCLLYTSPVSSVPLTSRKRKRRILMRATLI